MENGLLSAIVEKLKNLMQELFLIIVVVKAINYNI